jgi:hypothetical protein
MYSILLQNATVSALKVTKSITSVNIRPKTSSRNLPEQPLTTTPQNSSVPQSADFPAKLSAQQQNGVKEEEDIFSPLREGMYSWANEGRGGASVHQSEYFY